MVKTIQQAVAFKNVSPEELFELYLDSRKHSEVTGTPARINKAIGGKFTAFDGRLRGTILALIPGRRIVQTWREEPWRRENLDSILILNFNALSDGAQIEMVHANIPEHAYSLVNKTAWKRIYWSPLKLYLENKFERRHPGQKGKKR